MASVFSRKSFSSISFGQSFSGFEIVLPPAKPQIYGGGGGGSHGSPPYKTFDPFGIQHEQDLRAEIIRQDDEILAVIMSAVTCGALR